MTVVCRGLLFTSDPAKLTSERAVESNGASGNRETGCHKLCNLRVGVYQGAANAMCVHDMTANVCRWRCMIERQCQIKSEIEIRRISHDSQCLHPSPSLYIVHRVFTDMLQPSSCCTLTRLFNATTLCDFQSLIELLAWK